MKAWIGVKAEGWCKKTKNPQLQGGGVLLLGYGNEQRAEDILVPRRDAVVHICRAKAQQTDVQAYFHVVCLTAGKVMKKCKDFRPSTSKSCVHVLNYF